MNDNKIKVAPSPQSFVFPLALAQFISSYAGSSMNVAITDIANDLGTSVIAIQTAITVFTLTMAALMIPGSKLTDIWGRKFCFNLGLVIYGIGALIATIAQTIATLTIGWSLLEGIGSALMIPPIYIILTVAFDDIKSRAKAFGAVSGAASLGAAAGPLVGGLLTSAFSWRAAFFVKVIVIVWILILSRRITAKGSIGPKPKFDIVGAILSALGLFFIVLGILQSGTYGWLMAREDFYLGDFLLISQGGISPVWPLVGIGAAYILWFYIHVRSRERAGKEPLLPTKLFHNRVSNLGLVTQCVQWLTLLGGFFVISVYLQTVHGLNAIETGLMLTPSTIGIVGSAAVAERLAKKYSQRNLICAGFVLTIIGMILLLVLGSATSPLINFIPGLFVMGVGIGIMLTSSVNVVQSAFPEEDQGEISGLSRAVSNLGSSLGTALVGSILVMETISGQSYASAIIALIIIELIGLGAALLLPRSSTTTEGVSE
jgi:MFS family permease